MRTGCLVTTTYPITFDGGNCVMCGGQPYACSNGVISPSNPTFTDTSTGTFVSLSAILTADWADTYALSINNVVQGSFVAPIGFNGCGTSLDQCSIVDLIPATPQTGYVVGGLNTFALTSGDVGCYTNLVITVTTEAAC